MNFDDTFKELTGNVPYEWQVQLFGTLVSGHIPLNLSLPTGSGKTSAIVCWLLALCRNPSLPRRLVYVVDRRSVVASQPRS
jgi:CRISPR-associated endonuclease/helicase Cas3